MSTLFLLTFLLQDQAAELIERLRADDVEERVQAASRIKELGRAARPALERAAASKDADLAGRARRLLETLDIREVLPAALLKASPGLDDRIALDGAVAWSEALTLAVRGHSKLGITNAELEPLAAHVLRVSPKGPWGEVIGLAIRLKWRSVYPEILRVAECGDYEFHDEPGSALERMDPDEILPTLKRVISNGPSELRARAIRLRTEIEGTSFAAELAELTRDRASEVRIAAATALCRLNVSDATVTAAVRALLSDPEPTVRAAVLSAACEARLVTAGEIVPMLADRSPRVRATAAQTYADLDPEGGNRILPLLDDHETEVVRAAILGLARLRAVSAAPKLAALLDSSEMLVQMDAAEALSVIPCAQAAPRLAELAMSNERCWPASAPKALVAADSNFAARVGVKLASKHGDFELVSLLIGSNADALRELEEMLCDPDEAIRLLAARLLVKRDVKSAAMRIAGMLATSGDRMGHVSQLLELLRQLKVATTAPAISKLLKDESPRIRLESMATLEALGALTSQQADDALADVDDEVRVAALESLQRMKSSGSSTRIAQLRSDPSPSVRLNMLRALFRLDFAAGEELAIAQLSDASGEVRENAAMYLAAKGHAATPILRDALKRPESRAVVVSALREIGAFAEVDHLRPLIKDPNPDVRLRTAYALHVLCSGTCQPELIGLLDDPTEEVRRVALDCIGRLGIREAIPKVRSLLESKCWRDVRNATECLVALDAVEAVPDLRALLQKDPYAEYVIIALGRFGDRESLSRLLELLNEDWHSKRRAAAEALGWLGDRDAAAQPLLHALSDVDGEVRAAAATALARLGVREAVPRLARLIFSDPWLQVDYESARALVTLDGTAALPMLRREARGWVTQFRQEALSLIGELGSIEYAAELEELLADKDWSVRANAAYALGKIGHRKSIPKLLALLDDKDTAPRDAAVWALPRLGATEAIPRLIEGLASDSYWDRRTYIEALGRLKADAAAPALRLLLTGSSAADAARALAAARSAESIPDLRNALARVSAERGVVIADALVRLRAPAGAVDSLLVAAPARRRLHSMNVLRDAESWRALEARLLPSSIAGNAVELAAQIEQLTGIRIQLPKPERPSEEAWMRGYRRLQSYGGRATLMETLESLLEESTYEMIVEKDCVRVVNKSHALAFWKGWWTDHAREFKQAPP